MTSLAASTPGTPALGSKVTLEKSLPGLSNGGGTNLWPGGGAPSVSISSPCRPAQSQNDTMTGVPHSSLRWPDVAAGGLVPRDSIQDPAPVHGPAARHAGISAHGDNFEVENITV
jgi:hypothetical protein